MNLSGGGKILEEGRGVRQGSPSVEKRYRIPIKNMRVKFVRRATVFGAEPSSSGAKIPDLVVK